MPALLDIVDVGKKFPGVVALEGVSFEIEPGEFHALVGENGAGKSTLIHILSGVLQPDGGSIFLEGAPVQWADPVAARKAGVITVHQEAELFEPLSAAENMALEAGLPTTRLGLVDWRRVQNDATAAVATLRESFDVRQPASRLGVAHRHLAQLAAAVQRAAKVLILDEPTASLTAAETEWLFEQIARVRAAGVAVLYISHRQEEIFQWADRVTVLRDGKRVWTGPTSQLDRPRLVQIMVGRESTIRPLPTAARQRSDSDAPFLLECTGVSDAEGRCRNVDLQAGAGEIVGVYGLVGAGRSEWAQTLFGLRRRKTGDVKIAGEPVQVSSPLSAVRAGLAYLPEDRLHQGVCRGLSIRANAVLTTLRQWTTGMLASVRKERQAALAQTSALGVRMRSMEQPIGQLSGGNQQKVVFARWRLARPRVFLLDEPTRGVDVGAKEEIHRLIRQSADEGAAVVLISSELPELLACADRIVVFREGSVSAEFSRQEAAAERIATAALPASENDATSGRRPIRRLARSRLAWTELSLVVAVLLLGFSLYRSTDRFLTQENVVGVLASASVWTILALGASVVILAGGIDVSVGSLLALAAGVGGLIMTSVDPPALGVGLGIAAALAVGVGGGLTNAAVALAGGVHPIVVTLGTMTVFRGLLLLVTGGDSIFDLPASFTRLATGSLMGVSGSVWIMAAATTAAAVWQGWTPSGRMLYALGASPRAAWLVGVSQRRGWLTAFAVGGLLAGLAGLLELALTGSMQSRLGTGYELRAIAAAVIGGTAVTGGRGSPFGVALGALLLSMIQNALVLWETSPFHYDLVLGGLLTGAVLLDWLLRRFA